MEDMEIKKVELHDVLTCGLSESVEQVSKKLKEGKERRIFVVDDSGKLKGIITTTDLVYKVLAEGKSNLKAEDVMVGEVKSVDIKEDLEKALAIMNELKSFTCPVTEDGKVKGFISYHDLMGHVLASVEK